LARNALSSSATGLTYTAGTGAFSLTAGYNIPLTASTTDWNTSYLNRITGATYPLQISSNNLSLAFGTTSANSWSALQTFGNFLGTNGTTTNFFSTTASSTNLFATAANIGTVTSSGLITGSSFTGAGTGLTGTASSLSIGGNAATVTTNANLSGDVSSTGNTTTLATVNTNTGSFGSSTAIPNITVNGKGLITAAGTNAVIAPAGTLSGSTLASGVTASSLTSVGTLGSLTVSGLSTLGNVSATNSTTTSFGLNSETFTDLTGSGLSNTAGALTLDRTGTWTGTFDGQEGSYYLANSFATTSADVWLGTKSTTNLSEGTNLYYTPTRFASALAGTTTDALAQGSTNRYYADSLVQAFINASTTIPKAYSSNTFTGSNTFNGALTIGSLTGPLQAVNGAVSATSTLSTVYGGTGLSSAPSFGQILRGTGTGYALVATSTLGIALSDTTGTLAVNRGGTGLASYTAGDVLYASGTGTLAGTTTANLKTTLALNNVENTALSTWAGSTNLTTLGTIGTGTWNATAIGGTKGGTGLSTVTTNQLLIGGAGNTWTQVATSSLGLLTTNVAEGSNLYYTDARADARINATTTLGTLTQLPNLAGATTTNLYITSAVRGAGLSACSNSGDKLLWNATTGQFSCGTDAGAGGGLTSLNGQTGSSQTFATSSDTNIGLTITSSGDTHTFTPTFTGTFADSR
ncbi:MAG: hypothetical protein M3Q81_05805, partial [bacterium]|nr:hypothetical protein [bacterium]